VDIDQLFWQKLSGEPDQAYRAFATYRDLGISRSLLKAAAAFYAEKHQYYQGDAQGLPSGAQLTRFKNWSRQYMWVARCEAFDLEEARERSLRMRERRIRSQEQQFAVATLAMNRTAERLHNLALDGEQIPLKSIPALLNAAATLQRLAVGDATAALDIRALHTHTVAAEDADDDEWLRGLSLEDKEELARLYEKI
jgi:hypothetical protein